MFITQCYLNISQIHTPQKFGRILQDESKWTSRRPRRDLPVSLHSSRQHPSEILPLLRELLLNEFFGDQYKDKYNGRIAKKYHKDGGLSEFLKSGDFKGDGVYNFKGEALLIENGQVKKRQIIQPKVDKEGFFS